LSGTFRSTFRRPFPPLQPAPCPIRRGPSGLRWKLLCSRGFCRAGPLLRGWVLVADFLLRIHARGIDLPVAQLLGEAEACRQLPSKFTPSLGTIHFAGCSDLFAAGVRWPSALPESPFLGLPQLDVQQLLPATQERLCLVATAAEKTRASEAKLASPPLFARSRLERNAEGRMVRGAVCRRCPFVCTSWLYRLAVISSRVRASWSAKYFSRARAGVPFARLSVWSIKDSLFSGFSFVAFVVLLFVLAFGRTSLRCKFLLKRRFARLWHRILMFPPAPWW
jgi:hypothetical protein